MSEFMILVFTVLTVGAYLVSRWLFFVMDIPCSIWFCLVLF